MKSKLRILPIIKSGFKTCQDIMSDIFEPEVFVLIFSVSLLIMLITYSLLTSAPYPATESITAYNIDRKIEDEQNKKDMREKIERLKKLRQENGTVVP